MERWSGSGPKFQLAFFFLSLLIPSFARFQTNEQAIRTAYARYTLSSQISAANIAIDTHRASTPQRVTDSLLEQALSAHSVTFQLSAFKTLPANQLTPGTTDSLLTRPNRYDAEQIKTGYTGRASSESPKRTLVENEIQSSWGVSGSLDTQPQTLTLELKQHSYRWLQNVITYTVVATLDKRSKAYTAFAISGPDQTTGRLHMHLFDPMVQNLNDLSLIDGDQQIDAYPILMLNSIAYDTPGGRNLLRRLSVPASLCKPGGCCTDEVKCGVSAEDVAKLLSGKHVGVKE